MTRLERFASASVVRPRARRSHHNEENEETPTGLRRGSDLAVAVRSVVARRRPVRCVCSTGVAVIIAMFSSRRRRGATTQRVLHTVFEQDEWVLILAGTALGGLSGLAQVPFY